MRLTRAIDKASVELAVIESVVGTARHVLDTAVETERVAIRIAARLKNVAIVVVAGVVVFGLAYGVKSRLDHRRAESSEADEAPVDNTTADDIG